VVHHFGGDDRAGNQLYDFESRGDCAVFMAIFANPEYSDMAVCDRRFCHWWQFGRYINVGAGTGDSRKIMAIANTNPEIADAGGTTGGRRGRTQLAAPAR